MSIRTRFELGSFQLLTIIQILTCSFCPCHYKEYNNRCYAASIQMKSFWEGRRLCQRDGGDLFSANSAEEQNFVNTEIIKRFDKYPDVYFWIGLYSPGNGSSVEGDRTGWAWTDGTSYATSWQPWQGNEPGKHENVARIKTSHWLGTYDYPRTGVDQQYLGPFLSLCEIDPFWINPVCNNHTCFKLFFSKKSYNAAVESCLEGDGFLARYGSDSEDLLSGLFKEKNMCGQNTEQQLFWIRPTSELSCPGKTISESNYQLDETNCEETHPYICERASRCTCGWVEYDGSCYLMTSGTKLSQNEAEAWCQEKHGGHVVHIATPRLHQYLTYKLKTIDSAYTSRWLGLRRNNPTDNVWTWKGESTSAKYYNWQPSEGKKLNMMCANINNGRWYAKDCELQMDFICEKALDSPQPKMEDSGTSVYRKLERVAYSEGLCQGRGYEYILDAAYMEGLETELNDLTKGTGCSNFWITSSGRCAYLSITVDGYTIGHDCTAIEYAYVMCMREKPMVSSTQSKGGVVGGVLVVLFIIVLAAVLVLLWRKGYIDIQKLKQKTNIRSCTKLPGSRREPTGGEEGPRPPKPDIGPPTLQVIAPKAAKQSHSLVINANTDQTIYSNFQLAKRIPVEKLAATVKQLSQGNGFEKEYKGILNEKQAEWKAAVRSSVKAKNRFKDILPYDNSRVVLKVENDDPTTDYINASFIDGYHKQKAFIASQGPPDKYVTDFWRMIWEQNIQLIAMVTNLVEDGKRKCAQYWPKGSQSKSYGLISVTVLQEQTHPDFTIRKMKILKATHGNEGGQQRYVKQVHFTGWPDHGVPEHGTGLLNFYRQVTCERLPGSDVPVLVHCSAGVGRTGTLIAIDYCLQQAEKEEVVDVYGCVNLMRAARIKMVQTLEQYVFLYNTLLEALTVGKTTIPASRFDLEYRTLQVIDRIGKKSKIHSQYEVLEERRSTKNGNKTKEARKTENSGKNRNMDILPSDSERCILMTSLEGANNYINAVWVKGHKMDSAFIATQAPLVDTRRDLWRMVLDYNCSTVVMLCTEEEQESAGLYMPDENEFLSLPPVNLGKCVNVKSENRYSQVRMVEVSMKQKSQRVHHVGVSVDLGVLSAEELVQALLALYSQTLKLQQASGGAPLVVHCTEGVEWTGLFCATYTLCDMVNAEQQVDVFRVVNQIRKARPQFIPNMEQYQLLYVVVETYMKDFETYSNFQ